MGHTDGGKMLTETLGAYTATTNGEREDDFGKTVFPAKNFSAKQALCKSNLNLVVSCHAHAHGRLSCPVLMDRLM